MQKVPENSEVQGAPQKCGSSVWNLFHVTSPVHRTSRWLPAFGKLADPECGNVYPGRNVVISDDSLLHSHCYEIFKCSDIR